MRAVSSLLLIFRIEFVGRCRQIVGKPGRLKSLEVHSSYRPLTSKGTDTCLDTPLAFVPSCVRGPSWLRTTDLLAALVASEGLHVAAPVLALRASHVVALTAATGSQLVVPNARRGALHREKPELSEELQSSGGSATTIGRFHGQRLLCHPRARNPGRYGTFAVPVRRLAIGALE
jgi:hypothetical protein